MLVLPASTAYASRSGCPARRPGLDGVREPGRQAGSSRSGTSTSARRHQDGLDREQVRGGRGQQVEPTSVEVAQRIWGDAAATSVLRAVGQHCTVGADGCRDQQSATACGCDLVAHLAGQVDARHERAFACVSVSPRPPPSWHARLRRRRDDVGTGEVGRGGSRRSPRGRRGAGGSPQVGGEVYPSILEGVGQAAIQNEDIRDLHAPIVAELAALTSGGCHQPRPMVAQPGSRNPGWAGARRRVGQGMRASRPWALPLLRYA